MGAFEAEQYRRRKVRCDEQRPDCGHCSRLQLDCSWQQDPAPRPELRTRKARQRLQQRQNEQSESAMEMTKTASPAAESAVQMQDSLPEDDPAFNRIFNYASFMWDDYSPTISSSWDPLNLTAQDMIPWSDVSFPPSAPLSLPCPPSAAANAVIERHSKSNLPSPVKSSRVPAGWSESQLAEYFAHSAAPPILATVETNARWFWMRKELISMAASSRMVKFGVIAFVALELESDQAVEPAAYLQYYRTAKEQLVDCLKEISRDRTTISSQLRHILAVLFLLSYIDLLTKDVSNAHANLREGFHALQMVDIESLSLTGNCTPTIALAMLIQNTEKRLLSWLRLLDARAVSAGGEGLFLSDEDSAINTDLRSPDSAISELDSGLDDAEAALEDFVMRPAFCFFQKVELFMGRISKIDPWHRRRGTVEDETEVMLIAANISRDIKSLWQQRPPLMDHAVAGKLAMLLSPGLAETITRTMRVYHANYYASFIHLHRVAYKGELVSRRNNMDRLTQFQIFHALKM